MNDLIADLENTIRERGLSAEDASKFIGCSFIQVYRWLRRESVPTFLYRKAILRAIKKMKKMPSVNLLDLAKCDRNLYRRLKGKITHKEKDWLTERPESYSVYRERLKELARKHGIEKE